MQTRNLRLWTEASETFRFLFVASSSSVSTNELSAVRLATFSLSSRSRALLQQRGPLHKRVTLYTNLCYPSLLPSCISGVSCHSLQDKVKQVCCKRVNIKSLCSCFAPRAADAWLFFFFGTSPQSEQSKNLLRSERTAGQTNPQRPLSSSTKGPAVPVWPRVSGGHRPPAAYGWRSSAMQGFCISKQVTSSTRVGWFVSAIMVKNKTQCELRRVRRPPASERGLLLRQHPTSS